MRTIYKYTITSANNPSSLSGIMMPVGAEILSLQVQDGLICVWALIDKEQNLQEYRVFNIFGTGFGIAVEDKLYIDTIQHSGYVWHIYETKH